jgi:hypothetical protein
MAMAANAADKERDFEENRVIDRAKIRSLLMGLMKVVGGVEQLHESIRDRWT